MTAKIAHTADAIVFKKVDNEFDLLVIKRANSPCKNMNALPGGFIDQGETPLDACLRELYEETGLRLTSDQAIPLSVRKKEGRDPRGTVVSTPFLFYLGEVSEQLLVKGGDDALTAQWVPLRKLESLAFDHGAIICEALGIFWPFMPSFDNSLPFSDLPPYIATIELKNLWTNLGKELEVVFFGGSFNPWHLGHTACVELCVKEDSKNKIVIVPDFNPWKDKDVKKDHFCYFQKFLELTQQIKGEKISVYPGFWGKESSNPTVEWLPKVLFDNKKMLIGADNFLAFDKWKDYKSLISRVSELFVVPRNHSQQKMDETSQKIQELNEKLIIRLLDHHNYEKLSSTKIRND